MAIKPGRMISWLLTVAYVAIPACAATERYAISVGQVAVAMGKAGVPIAPEQVTLLTDVKAATKTPVLKVRSVEKTGDQRLVARLECTSSDECLPFFVSVNVGQGGAEQTNSASAKLLLAGLTRMTGARSMVLRSGSTATLELDGAHVHIRLPVICMESGAAGQTIRVTDKNHRMIYRAEVIDGGLLKGRLQ